MYDKVAYVEVVKALYSVFGVNSAPSAFFTFPAEYFAVAYDRKTDERVFKTPRQAAVSYIDIPLPGQFLKIFYKRCLHSVAVKLHMQVFRSALRTRKNQNPVLILAVKIQCVIKKLHFSVKAVQAFCRKADKSFWLKILRRVHKRTERNHSAFANLAQHCRIVSGVSHTAFGNYAAFKHIAQLFLFGIFRRSVRLAHP